MASSRNMPSTCIHVIPPEYVSPIPPNIFAQCDGCTEGCFPRALLSLASFCPRCEVFFKAPEYVSAMRGALLRGAPHEHIGTMRVALCPPSPLVQGEGCFRRRRDSSLLRVMRKLDPQSQMGYSAGRAPVSWKALRR